MADSRLTYRELLERLLAHRTWIDAQDVPTGPGSRFAWLCNALEFVDEAYRTGRVSELLDNSTNAATMWGLVEATELEAVLRRLRPLHPEGLTDVLRMALAGEKSATRIPPTPDGEGESASTRARNEAFQLVVGAHLSRLDGNIAFVEPDVIATLDRHRLVCACKRPFSAKGLLERSEEGSRQIARIRSAPGDVGILAVAADRIVSRTPGRLHLNSPSEDAATSFLADAIADGPLREIEDRLDAIGDELVDVVVVQASVPVVIGDSGLHRLSETVLLFRSLRSDLTPEKFMSRLEDAFRSM
jgi:hypothetical protein